MLKRLIGIAAILCGFAVPSYAACSGSSPSYTAASTSYADVSACNTLAVDGDTITVPAGTSTWSSTLTITAAITLQGNGIGSTIIRDGVASGSNILMNVTLVAGKNTRITGFEINWNGAGDPNPNGVISVTGTSATGGTIRFDHNKLDHLQTFNVRTSDVRGVFDHNTFLYDAVHTPFYIYDPGSANYGDQSWHNSVTWGSTDFLFIEDNTITHDTVDGACTDGNSGSRAVFRFNTVTNCSFQNHGTESFGRPRSGRAMEVYGNVYVGVPDEILGIRGGSAVVWGNTGVASVQAAVKMVNDRSAGPFYFWGASDGTNAWDVNDAGNPFQSKTASSGGTLTVTVTGAGWTVNQWAGYTVKKTSACTGQCNSVIQSNTVDTLTFISNGGYEADMTFTNGETFNINKVTRAQDQPGVGGGTLIVTKCDGGFMTLTSVGTTATGTCTSHGLTTGDYASIQDYSSGTSPYNIIAQVTVTNANVFTYTCPTTCGASTTGAVTKIPSPNDQTYFPIYQWLNDNGTSNVVAGASPSAIGVVIENQSFYNYGGTLQSNATTPFNGTPATNNGIGVGTIARRPTNCTTGVWYWATDQGSWRTATPSTGQTFQGLGYQCTATNTWTLTYTPATYPYSGIVSCTPDHLTFTAQPSSAVQGVALGTITVAVKDSGGSTCTSDTSTVTLAKKGGTCTGMTLNGTVSGSAVAGVFTTSDVNLTVGTGSCTLTATDGALTSADSSSFTISAPSVSSGLGLGERFRLRIP